ncbi:MAG TPA: D-glycerate dehydrogenase [Syntrophales bacterium]|nr:D-glycerate dehydrogenase [Syntrophales bacterium]
MNKHILVTGHLPEIVMTELEKVFIVDAYNEDKPYERQRLLHSIKDKDGLISMITDNVDEEVLDRASRLKMIAHFGVGYNNIDIKAATTRGIAVSNTPGVLTDATAELAFALILAVARRLVECDRATRDGRFRYWAPMLFLGREVTGKTLGIIGLGEIGKAVARRAKGFKMRILYNNRNRINASEEKELTAEFADLQRLLAESDFISLHVPLTSETRHLIGKEEFSLMKPTTYLINTSRGPVVDEQALLESLQNGTIGGAGLDVYENEPSLTPGLKELSNIVLLPHIGSGTLETRIKMASMVAENLIAGLSGSKPPNIVNPEVLQHRRLVK